MAIPLGVLGRWYKIRLVSMETSGRDREIEVQDMSCLPVEDCNCQNRVDAPRWDIGIKHTKVYVLTALQLP